jgi:hypothetical protein
MKRQTEVIRRVLLVSLVALTTASLPVRAQYGGGSGTADDPYLIETAEQMNTIGLRPEDWDKHFRLTADIDMNDLGGTRVNLIGTLGDPFGGVFDGNSHTIANLVYLVKDEDSPPTWSEVFRIGLFRVISGWDALVKDLGLIEPAFQPDPSCTKAFYDVGALVGSLGAGWIRNCYVNGGHVLGHRYVGGLVGDCYSDAAVSESWSTAEVSGHGIDGAPVGYGYGSDVGGLIGCVGGASVWSCHAGAHVSGVANVGGLVGTVLPGSTVEDSFTTGTVAGSQAGGLVGYLDRGSVSRCYSTASVSGSFSLGGLVGVNYGLIDTSWAGGEVTGGTTLGGLVGRNTVGGGFLNILPYFDTKVTDSYATGAVHGDGGIGGLIGSNEGTLLRCYSTGVVTTSRPVPASTLGGLVGNDTGVPEWDVLGCFWDTMTSSVDNSEGGTGMTTDQMQDLAIYLAAGWDFVGETANGAEDLWKMPDEGPGYPKLAWEEASADDPNGTD